MYGAAVGTELCSSRGKAYGEAREKSFFTPPVEKCNLEGPWRQREQS